MGSQSPLVLGGEMEAWGESLPDSMSQSEPVAKLAHTLPTCRLAPWPLGDASATPFKTQLGPLHELS